MKTMNMEHKGFKVAIAVLISITAIITMAWIMSVQTENAYADAYKYKVTIYSGSQGTFAGGKTVWSKEYDQGEHVSITMKSLGFKLKNKKYYDRGFVIAGHDNDETTGFKTLSFDASQDVEYIVAYGIKGAMVKYFARYEDTKGNTIHKQNTYYGMAGDKPVVSFLYLDGWTPQTYNMAKTLSKDESKNVMTFIYSKEGTATAEDEGDNGGNGGDNGQQQGQGGNGQTQVRPAAPGTQQNPAGTNVNGNDGNDGNDGTTNIDDTPGPTTDGNDGTDDGNKQYTDLDPEKKPTALPFSNIPMIVGSIIGLLILLALVLFLLKKKKNESEEIEPEE